ncbi:hypothetical protein J6590_012624 [Homalodisca vitripennis]|nr:hypothetical protein J6590_012624 [Homalodisca vitripennis]
MLPTEVHRSCRQPTVVVGQLTPERPTVGTHVLAHSVHLSPNGTHSSSAFPTTQTQGGYELILLGPHIYTIMHAVTQPNNEPTPLQHQKQTQLSSGLSSPQPLRKKALIQRHYVVQHAS